jgi:hypothetical protein
MLELLLAILNPELKNSSIGRLKLPLAILTPEL